MNEDETTPESEEAARMRFLLDRWEESLGHADSFLKEAHFWRAVVPFAVGVGVVIGWLLWGVR